MDTESPIMNDTSPMKYAISLGVFRTEDAARTRLEELRARGVRTAQLGERESQGQRSFFQIRDASESVKGRLNELKQGFAGSEVRECGSGTDKLAARAAGAIG